MVRNCWREEAKRKPQERRGGWSLGDSAASSHPAQSPGASQCGPGGGDCILLPWKLTAAEGQPQGASPPNEQMEVSE